MLTKLYINMKPDTVSNLCAFREYVQSLRIVHELKNYRPKRRPITSESPKDSKIAISADSFRRKRLLIVRDWFFFAVWANRIAVLIRAGNKSQNDRDTKLHEFQRLYSRLIQHQHRPTHDPFLHSSRPVRTDEGSYGGANASSDDYFAAMERKMGKEEETRREVKTRLLKTFADTQIAFRLQELTLGLYSSNTQARAVGGKGKPLFELHLLVSLLKLTWGRDRRANLRSPPLRSTSAPSSRSCMSTTF